MTNKEEKEGQQQQQKNDNKIPKNDYSYLHKKAGFLPPQALPTPPPPPPIPNEDTSSLTSPWWSEETSDTSKEEIQEQEGMSETIAITTTATTTSTSATTTTSTTNGENTTITLLGFGRSSKSKGEWKEKCYMLATTQGGGKKDENFDKEFKRLTEQSKDCSMVCFLKESKQLTQQRRQQVSMWDDFNPFFGTWITVTRSPTKCRQHLETEYIQKKNQSDYYTMELGDGLYHSGEYVKNAVSNVFGPLHRLGVRYIDSWQNGNQQAFFSRFVDSLKRGDGIYLVRDSTKRLIENALGESKKHPPNDNKNK